MTSPFHALFIRGPQKELYGVAEQLGFEDDMPALAISLFEDGPDSQHLQALYESRIEAQAALSGLNLSGQMEGFVIELPDEDWVALSQAGLAPVRAGRFWVYGAHDADNIPKDAAYPLHIEAGSAFGTGHHGTTEGCLLMLDRLINEGAAPKRILDLGCGAGILAIAAAKALGQPVLATDIDPEAVTVTRQNARQNGVEALIEAQAAIGLDPALFKTCRFDLIFANILAGPLMEMAPDIAAHLATGGRVILSGILDAQADNVSRAFIASGLDIKKQPSIEGWTSLLGTKP